MVVAEAAEAADLDIASQTLRLRYQHLLDKQKRVGIYNYLDKIVISDVKIVGMENYINNDQDNFTAYISGSMLDIMVRKKETIIKKQGTEEFEDLYYFQRKDNRWYLVDISNAVDIWQLSELKITVEE